jgi:hypothetical protein
VDVGRLPRAERIALAQLQGAAVRLARGHRDPGEPTDPAIALRTISTDPMLLGLAAGVLEEHHSAAVELLRAAGADMQVAADHAAWIRDRRARRGPGPVL